MKRIIEIAKDLNIDSQRIYRYIKKNNIKFEREGNAIVIDKQTETKLKSIFGNKEKEKTKDTDQNKLTDLFFNEMKKQLELKDKQLQEKDLQIKDLHRLIDQQQQLQLADKVQSENLIETSIQKKSWRFWDKK